MTRSRSGPSGPPTSSESHSSRLLLGIGLAVALGLLAWWSARPPAALPEDAPAESFSAERAATLLDRLAGEGTPHPTGSPAAAALREAIADHLNDLGWRTEIQEVVARSPRGGVGTVRNVVARSSGRVGEPAVLLMAHYDSVGAGPGMADDLSAVATILEIARALEEEPRGKVRRHPVIALITEGEEVGLLGAAGFLDRHPWAQDVGVVLNLEARGSSGPSHLFETGGEDAWLIEAFARHAARPNASSFATEIYRRMPNDTDFSIFREEGFAGLNFAFIGDWYTYHTALDDRAHLSLESVQHQGQQVLAALRAIEEHEGETRRGDAVYVTLFGRWLVHLGTGSAWVLGLVAAAALLWALQRCARRGHVRWGAVSLGLFATPFGVLVTAAIAIGYAQVLRSATGTWSPWHATPSPTWIALGGAALFGACVGGGVGRRLAGPAALALASWCWWGVGALLLALFVPGACPFALAPALLLALLANAVRLDDALEARLGRVALCALVFATVFWAPLLLGLAEAFRLERLWVTSLAIALPATLTLPLMANATPIARRSLAVLGLACLVFGASLTLVLPHESPQRPQRLNLVYAQEEGEAQWQAWGYGAPLPESLAAALPFDEEGDAIGSSWSGWSARVAPADDLGLPPPRIEWEITHREPDERDYVHTLLRVKARVFSPSGAARTRLRVRGPWKVEGMALEGTELVPSPFLTLVAVPPAGYQLDLVLAGIDLEALAGDADGEEGAEEREPVPLEILLVDRVHGLPEEGAFLDDARGESFVARGDGDGCLLVSKTEIAVDEP